MKKHFTTGQIKWIIAICLMVSFLTNLPDVIKGLKEGYNSVRMEEIKK